MFELVFNNGRSLQYRKSDYYDDDLENLCELLFTLKIPFTIYFNHHRISFPVDLKKLCRIVA